MAQAACDRADVDDHCDHHRGEGVAQVVEGAVKAVHLAEGDEVLAELGGVVGAALRPLRAEDEGVQ